MAEHQLTCRTCGAQFTHHRRKAYCRRECRPSMAPRTPTRTAVIHRDHECYVCGKAFKPRGSDRTKCCGRECGLKWSGLSASLRRTGGRVWVRTKRLRPRPKSSKVYYEPIVAADCRNCGRAFDRRDDGASRYMCSVSCAEAAAAKVKRAGRKKRKALERGARIGEIIDPLAVFERDGWRCGVCGCKTHKAKRGTIHPRAPELDHIVALANGGTHTWCNVQCACRECNGRKGATDYGQILLFSTA